MLAQIFSVNQSCGILWQKLNPLLIYAYVMSRWPMWTPEGFFIAMYWKQKKHYILEVYYITKQVHDFHVASTVLFLDNI